MGRGGLRLHQWVTEAGGSWWVEAELMGRG